MYCRRTLARYPLCVEETLTLAIKLGRNPGLLIVRPLDGASHIWVSPFLLATERSLAVGTR